MTVRTVRLLCLAAVLTVAIAVCGVTAPIGFSPSTHNPRVGQSVQFTICGSCLEDPSYVFEWDLDGDGRYETESQELTVSATFAVEGYVEVSLRAAGSGGHRSIASHALIVGETPYLAQRELIVEPDGALRVNVTVELHESALGLGIEEDIPAGWELEIVDEGLMSAHAHDGRLYILWLSEPLPGETYSFAYRLYRGSAWDSPMLSGQISGYPSSRPKEYVVVRLCGEIWEPGL
jgi:hypothetical protein